MSIQSQKANMRQLHELLSCDLGFIRGERESGPNGAKKTFLHVSKVFLRALSKDLGLRDAVIKSNAGGIGVSGECSLCGMWENSGIYVCISQFGSGGDVFLYRTIRSLRDRHGGYNRFLPLSELEGMRYEQLLERLGSLRRDSACEEAA